MPKKKNPTLYEKIYLTRSLEMACQTVCEHAMSSGSSHTLEEAKTFLKNKRNNIERISKQIRNKKFTFSNNTGVIGSKKNRPIVLAPIDSRIVQRSILNVLQSIKDLEPYYKNSGSFGAIKNEDNNLKGVPGAISALIDAIHKGAKYYYQSDIKQFFTQIPRKLVINKISNIIGTDRDFIDILERATNLEISNISSIPEEYKKHFIYEEIGTPQGCALSPLLGNILLEHFDTILNTEDIKCLRYLDDFIILGPNIRSVKRMFEKGLKELNNLGLSAYQLKDGSMKASFGSVEKSFEFLGIEINGKTIRPAKKSRKRLKDSLQEIINYSLMNFSKCSNGREREHSLIQTFYKIDNKLRGWGNQYAFCNDNCLFHSMDREINEIIKIYLKTSKTRMRALDWKGKRRILGLHLITESKRCPISL